jgi:hypothetical protein
LIRKFIILAALAICVLSSSAALAQAPSNDDLANAVDVTALPFTHTVDITEATQGPEDLSCGTTPGSNTVWYKITPAIDLSIGFHTESSVDELSLSVFAGPPGSFIMLYCSYSYYNKLEAAAGTTYYVQLATCCGSLGGPVTLSMQDIPDLTVELRLDRRAQIDGAGITAVSGNVRCNRATTHGGGHTVQGILTQGDTRGWLLPVHFTDGCSAEWRAWSTTVQLISGYAFTSGRASLQATAFACDEYDGCAQPTTKNGEVRLR